MHCRFKAYHERHLGKSYACRKLLFDGQAMRRLLLRFFRSVPSRLTRALSIRYRLKHISDLKPQEDVFHGVLTFDTSYITSNTISN